MLGRDVPLIRDWVDGGTWHADLEPGEVVLLENCRFNPGEKKDDDDLARRMAQLCDVYCNDAFGTAHRAEATTHGIARYAPVACAGPLLAAELDALGKALAKPARPLVAIVAGSKVSTKLSVLTNLAAKVDANAFVAIVDPDQTAILAVGQVAEQAVARNGALYAIPELTLTLTVDHRVVDGVAAAKFLETICEDLERGEA